MKPYLEAGEFVTTHGIAGELRLYPWCDGPAFMCAFDTLYLDADGKKPLPVEAIRPHKNICLVKLNGVDSIDDARPFIGKIVYIARADADLPDGSYFVQDLLGARVVDANTGEEYGTIATITHPGRHDVYEVTRPNGKAALFPAAEPFIEETDIEGKIIRVRPVPGLFDPEDAIVLSEEQA